LTDCGAAGGSGVPSESLIVRLGCAVGGNAERDDTRSADCSIGLRAGSAAHVAQVLGHPGTRGLGDDAPADDG